LLIKSKNKKEKNIFKIKGRTKMNQTMINDLDQKVQELLSKYKSKEEEIQRQLYELEAQQKLIEQNLNQQKEILRQTFGTDDIEEIKKIKEQYESTLQEMIKKIENEIK
jgi:aminoglycoside phosphotransferase family enzyme